MRLLPRLPIVCFAAVLLAAPSVAQIVVVPLEPAPGAELPDPDTGLYPTEPVTGFDPLPSDPGAGWTPELDPIDPNAVDPWGPVGEAPVMELLPPGSVVGQDVTTVEEDTVLTGTGAILKGLDKLITQQTSLVVHIDDDPLTTVVRGTGRSLEDEATFSKVYIN